MSDPTRPSRWRQRPKRTPIDLLPQPSSAPLTCERLQKVAEVLAWLVVHDSDAYAPLFKKVKAELDMREDTKQEAATFLQQRRSQSTHPLLLPDYREKQR
ncbi:hypothetical protein [Flexibacterium corallicola]|uniref:hypothetical protein n=1 Tax=Flexibacterium corallicola TaxID=3037259 RepID=UPI00286EE64D|nr:hypothetical protein [Pseudovibrio sp. M1P-2-3]